MNERVARLRELLEEPLLVTSATSVFYLSGFKSSNAALLVDPERVRLFTDFRYAQAARAVPDVEVTTTRRDLIGELGEVLRGRVAFEAAAVTYAQWQKLTAGSAELVPRTGLVERLRAVKDDHELAAIARAAEIADAALRGLVEEHWVGRTERELAWRLEALAREAGAEKLSFESAFASGPNGALPHGKPTDRRLEAGELVVVDWGCVVDGYCSDCTRTFATGDLPDDLQRIYDVCFEAQETALRGVAAGVTGVEADGAARRVIEAAGFGEQFGHGLGHGVGLEVHEAPTLRPESRDTLAAGNVVTVEPGIYVPGRGGVRIEDLVVVRDGGADVLTSFPKELTTVR